MSRISELKGKMEAKKEEILAKALESIARAERRKQRALRKNEEGYKAEARDQIGTILDKDNQLMTERSIETEGIERRIKEDALEIILTRTKITPENARALLEPKQVDSLFLERQYSSPVSAHFFIAYQVKGDKIDIEIVTPIRKGKDSIVSQELKENIETILTQPEIIIGLNGSLDGLDGVKSVELEKIEFSDIAVRKYGGKYLSYSIRTKSYANPAQLAERLTEEIAKKINDTRPESFRRFALYHEAEIIEHSLLTHTNHLPKKRKYSKSQRGNNSKRKREECLVRFKDVLDGKDYKDVNSQEAVYILGISPTRLSGISRERLGKERKGNRVFYRSDELERYINSR